MRWRTLNRHLYRTTRRTRNRNVCGCKNKTRWYTRDYSTAARLVPKEEQKQERKEYQELGEMLGHTSAKSEFLASPEEKARLKAQREKFNAMSPDEQARIKERFLEIQNKSGDPSSLKGDFLKGE